MTLRPLAISCANDYKGHSLVQTSFTDQPNRDIAHAVRQTVLIKCNLLPIQNIKHGMRAIGMMFSNVYTMFFRVHVYTPSRTLRSSSDTRMLEIQQYKRKTLGFRTFSCFGPHIWNSLPHCSTLSSFKAKLKTFLFSQYFHLN